MDDVESLINALASNDEQVINNAYRVLQESWETFVDKLIAGLQSPNLEIRRAVTNILCSRTEPRAADAFLNALKDEDAAVKVNAMFGLGKLKDKRAIDPIKHILWHDSNYIVRSSAAHMLGMIGNPIIFEDLVAALQDPYPAVHYGAIDGLGYLGDKRALPYLITALKDDDSVLRFSAATALGELGDTDAVEPLIEALRVSGDKSRIHMAGSLGKLNDSRAVEPLILALRTGDHFLRLGAALALAKLKDPRATRHLLAVLESDEYFDVRLNTIYALEAIGDPMVKEPILGAMQTDSDPMVRWVAAECLGRSFKDPKITDALIAMLGDPHPVVHNVVISALGNTGDPRAIEPLINILESPDVDADKSTDRCSAALSLGKLGGDTAIDALIAALSDESADVRTAASKALEKSDDPRAKKALRDYQAGI